MEVILDTNECPRTLQKKLLLNYTATLNFFLPKLQCVIFVIVVALARLFLSDL